MQQLRLQFFLETGPALPSERAAAPPLEASRAGATPSHVVAGIEDHTAGDPLRINTHYILRAGVVADEQPVAASFHTATMPPDFVPMSADEAKLTFDIVVRAEDVEVLPKHHQSFTFVPYQQPDLLRFTLIPRTTGHKVIIVEFYYERKWLQAITLEVEVEDQPELP